MSNEKEIKKEMLEQMGNNQTQKQQVQAVLNRVMGKLLTKKARERLGNLKAIKPQLTTQVQAYLYQLYQTGQIQGKISDSELKQILKKLNKQKEIKIKRK